MPDRIGPWRVVQRWRLSSLGVLRRHRQARIAAVPLAAVVVLAATAYVALKFSPDLFAADPFPDDTCRPGDKTFKECLDAAKARADDRRGVTTATLALFAGALSAVGVFYTARTFALNRKNAAQSHELDRAGQLTERFTRAIDQVGEKDKLAVRLGGIYALEGIARDSTIHHPQIVEVITAYVREHAPWRPEASIGTPAGPGSADAEDADAEDAQHDSIADATKSTDEALPRNGEGEQKLPTDVQAAMTVLGRRDDSKDRGRLDLARTNLRGVALEGANLDGAVLDQANLQYAQLRNANLELASFSEANLQYADVSEARLRGAQLSGANLQHAHFFGADARGARFISANLEYARFQWAKLEGAHLEDANLQGASLDGTDLHGAYLENATLLGASAILAPPNLQDAVLVETNLRGADLHDANLGTAHLHAAKLQDADLNGANLQDADLRDANLQDADLRGANLQGARLGAQFEFANRQGAGTIPPGANLRGAKYDDSTVWPTPDFNADARGARRVDPDEQRPSYRYPDN
jgi:uncharacterized protein YjbI with pentapeptide repeats